MKLTKEEFDNELNDLVSKHIITNMKEEGLINEDEFNDIKQKLLKIYHPLISTLLEGLPCESK